MTIAPADPGTLLHAADAHLIGGQWVPAAGGRTIEVLRTTGADAVVERAQVKVVAFRGAA